MAEPRFLRTKKKRVKDKKNLTNYKIEFEMFDLISINMILIIIFSKIMRN